MTKTIRPGTSGAGPKSKKSKNEDSFTPKLGSLHSISLRNFMSYTRAEFEPGSKFNVIIGPNGSGKSSIVTAIVVGLGGDFKSLKRQKELKDLVNKSTDIDEKAEIIIKLHRGEVDDDGNPLLHTIECKINRHSTKPEFKKNGMRVDQKEIQTLAKKCHIQTNNLCQFLPQDVVREFPEMKPQQVFHNTLKAVGNTEMLEIHEKLSSKQDQKTELETTVKTKERTLQDLERKFEDKRQIRETIKKKQALKQQINLFRKQRTCLEGRDLMKKLSNATKESKDLDEQIKEAKKKQKHLEDKEKKFVNKINTLTNESKKDQTLLNETCEKLRKSEVDQITDRINLLTQEIAELEERKLTSKRKAAELSQRIRQLETEIENANEAAIDSEIESCQTNIRALEEKCENFRHQRDDYISKMNISEGKIRNEKANREKLQSADSKRLNLLRNFNEDAYKGVQWLRQNKDSENFENPGGIYEPIMTVVRKVDKNYAIQLEDTIGNADLEAFVCVNERDMNKLMNKLRKDQKLRNINVVQVPKEIKNYTHPQINTRDTGKMVFLDDIIRECPQNVKRLLCEKKKLHMTPVFEKEPRETPTNLTKFYVNKTKHQIFGSKYTTAKSTSTEALSIQRSRYFDEADSENVEIKDIEKRINDENVKVETYQRNIKAIETEIATTKNDIQTENLKKEKCQEAQKKLHSMKRAKQNAETQLQMIKSNLSFAQQKEKLINEKTEQVKKLIPESIKLYKMVEKATTTSLEIEEKSIRIKQLETLKQRESRPLEQAIAALQTLQATQEEKKRRIADLRKEIEVKIKEAENGWKAPEKNPFQFPPDLAEEIERECPKTLAEVKARLESITEEYGNLPNVTERDEKEVDDLELQVKRTKQTVKELRNKLEMIVHNLERDQKVLEDGILEIIDKLNAKFRELMESMGFAGEIALDKGQHSLDFKNYGIKILVKFRNTESLKLLSSSVQSGGEKSVTTALYIMSLQGMTQVPFRCVDEINQGMDEQNEKRVWELLVGSAEQHSAQFLYLAPKFPQTLKFDENMHIHTCFNGQFDLRRANNRILIDDVIQKLKRRRNR